MREICRIKCIEFGSAGLSRVTDHGDLKLKNVLTKITNLLSDIKEHTILYPDTWLNNEVNLTFQQIGRLSHAVNSNI